MAARRVLTRGEEPRSDSYRFAVKPQVYVDRYQTDEKPIKKKKITKKPTWMEIENLKDELDILEHKVSLDALAQKLQTNYEYGISNDRAKYTLEKDGPNELSPPRVVPEWIRFSRHLFSGFSLLLWVACILSFVVYSIQAANMEEPPFDHLYLGFIVAAIIVVISSFAYYQEAQSSRILEFFKNLSPQFAIVIRKGEKLSIHAEELVVGDIVEVKFGDLVPADIRLIYSKGFKVNNFAITGESEPQTRIAGEATNENPLQTRNLAFYSTVAIEGTARGVVIGTGDRTVVGRIAKLAARMEEEKASLIVLELRRVVYIVSILATFFSLLFFFISLMVGFLWLDAIIYLIGLIIAFVPEGLLCVVAISLSIASHRMADKNCLVKSVETAETLGSTTVICSDKTGSLTQNKMRVAHLWMDGKMVEADLTPEQSYATYGRDSATWMSLARAAMLCNKAEYRSGQEGVPPLQRSCRGDQLDAALLRFVDLSLGYSSDYRARNKKICEIPFSSSTRYQVSIHEVDDHNNPRYLMVMKGAPERIMDRCSTIIFEGRDYKINARAREDFHKAYVQMGSMGETVIGFCDLILPPDQFPDGYPFDTDLENFPQTGLRFIGMISFFDPPRPSVPDAIARCHSAGIKVIMITGDHPVTAKAVAKGVGIITSETIDDIATRLNIPVTEINPRDARSCVIHGADLHSMSPNELDDVIASYPELVFARTTAQQKLLIVESCQRLGSVVAVTGNGLNDSPALKQADIGIAMAMSGSEVSKQAADILLLDDNFASIVGGIEEGRLIYENIKKTIAYTLTSNMPEMIALLMYIILAIPLPMAALTILCIDLGTDILPSIALAFEEPETDIMKKGPRDTDIDQLIGYKVMGFVYGQIGLIQVIGAFFTYFAIMAEVGFWPKRLLGIRDLWNSRGINDLEDSYGQEWSYVQRKVLEYTCQSAFFMAIVVMQWSSVIVYKAKQCSIFEQRMMNQALNWSLIFETIIAFLLLYLPGLDKGLRMYPLRFTWWLAPFLFSLTIVVYGEIVKLIRDALPKTFIADEVTY